MSELKSNGVIGLHLKDLRDRSRRRKMQRKLAMLLFVLIWIFLAILVAGCASPQPKQCEPAPQIMMPVIPLSQPTMSYSMKASQLFEKWRALLTNASQTIKP